MIIGRRKILLATLVVILGAAVFVNWYLGSSETKEITVKAKDASKNLGDAQYVSSTTLYPANDGGDTSDYFSDVRLERQQTRDAVLDELKGLSTQESSEAVTEITENIKKENDIENLIKAKGIDECVATLNDENLSVVVRCDELTDAMLLQIKEIAHKQTQIKFENITIVKVK